MRSRLGCLSFPAIFASLVALLAITSSTYFWGGAIFSAGALNAEPGKQTLGGVASHNDIGDKCKVCHAAPWESDAMADRCLLCHTNISAELKTTDQLHGVLYQGFPNRNCRDCHPEHRGAHASLVDMNLADFPHTNMKFALSSHKQKAGSQGNAGIFSGTSLNMVASALPQTSANKSGGAFTCSDCHKGGYRGPFDVSICVDCHYGYQPDFTQAHALEFGTGCLNCHDGIETVGANFNHNAALFQLQGKHVPLACSACHVSAHSLTDLRATPQDCFACHQKDDAHKGKFGTSCAACHTPDSWDPFKFDHSLTGFPLDGKHIGVVCEKCHLNDIYHGTSHDCVACHQKDDKHNGQMGTNCAGCHTTAGWAQVNINHSLFAFPLTGAHVRVACETCHKNGVFKGTPQDCYSCHQAKDPHQGRFGKDCAACHTTEAWKPANFDHNLAAFKLTGAHTTAACAGCHQNGVYQGTPQDCYSCHRAKDAHQGSFGTNCATCHSTSAWKPANFDHNLAAFKLTGAHVNAACARCHVNGVFKGTPQDCYACHRNADKHNGQFGTNCAACHNTSTWKGATFDHNLAAFKLTGAHVNAACTRCHVNGVYKGTPQDCYACHRNADKHNGQFGTNCAACHNTSTWAGATFDHNLAAFKLTGAHVSAACTRCHVNGVYKGTPQDCYSCHRNADKHGGQFGTNCAACHSTASWSGATFNHSLAAFKLTGAHVNAACSRCHANGVYKGTPKDCYSCHSGKNHGMGTNCAACHSTSTWSGATFNHNAFPLTGRHAGASCASCHRNGVYKGTPKDCYSCHSGKNHGMGTNCAACHSTSTWSGAKFSHPAISTRHGGASCATCHPNGYGSATCLACHDSNNPSDGEGDGGGEGGGRRDGGDGGDD